MNITSWMNQLTASTHTLVLSVMNSVEKTTTFAELERLTGTRLWDGGSSFHDLSLFSPKGERGEKMRKHERKKTKKARTCAQMRTKGTGQDQK